MCALKGEKPETVGKNSILKLMQVGGLVYL